MGDYLMSILIDILPWIFLFQIGMLIDCLTNKSIKGWAKFGWIMFIWWGQGIGPILYFFFGPSALLNLITDLCAPMMHTLIDAFKSSQQQRQQQIHYVKHVEPQPKAYDEPIRTYEQGYQTQNTPNQASAEREPEYYQLYEQPQSSYPEQPRQ